MKPIDPAKLREVVSTTLYPIHYAAGLIGCHANTLERWCDARSYPLAHSPGGRRFVAGEYVLAIAGEFLALEGKLDRFETAGDLARRSKGELTEFRQVKAAKLAGVAA
jgi:hypothetical protein